MNTEFIDKPYIITYSNWFENGTDISIIQKLLGHGSLKTTQIYTHISYNLISNVPSPISNISIQ